MEIRRKGKNIYIGEQTYRFPTPYQTAQAAFKLRNLPLDVVEDAKRDVVTEFKGQKI